MYIRHKTKIKNKKQKTKNKKQKTMENFNLKKFLTENKLTTNSRMVSENEEQVDE